MSTTPPDAPFTESPAAFDDPRPTNIRHVVVAAAFLMSVLLYLHRFCISVAQTYIQEDLNLSNEQVGWMLSAFFWTYALGQVPSGWLTDRFGSRVMLTSYILLWSLFTGLTGAASAFVAVLALRFGFGFAQAGAYPTAASIVSKWVPFQSRGLASGVISMGGRVGAVFAMFATGYLLVWLTPSDTPTTFDATSIRDAARFCHELAEQPAEATPESELRQRSLAKFSTAGQTLVTEQAARYERELNNEQARIESIGKSADEAAPDVQLSADDLALLQQEINNVLRTQGLFTANHLSEIKVENEARRLANRGATLSETQNQRLNRLVIESLHRQSLMKLYVAGWRPLMFLYGTLGIFVAAIIWWSCHKTPADHPRVNAAEVDLIGSHSKPAAKPSGQATAVVLKRLVTSVSMWCCCASQVFTNIGWAFLMLLAPRYFTNEHQLSIETVAMLSALPPIAGGLGMFSGGPITDRLVHLVGLRWGRALPMSLSRFVAMSAYIICLFGPSPLITAGLFAVVAFSTGIGTPATWAFNQDVGGRYVGSVLGWGNMWGNLGAAVTAPLLLFVVGTPERWNYAFITCASAFFMSGIVALGVNATISIAPTEDDEKTAKIST